MHILEQITKSQGLNFLICRMGILSEDTKQEWELSGRLSLMAATVFGPLLDTRHIHLFKNLGVRVQFLDLGIHAYANLGSGTQVWTWSSVMLRVYLHTQFESDFIQVFSAPVWLHPSHEVRRSGVDSDLWCQIRTQNVSNFGAIWISNQIRDAQCIHKR